MSADSDSRSMLALLMAWASAAFGALVSVWASLQTAHYRNKAKLDNRGQLGLGTVLAAFVVVIATFVVIIVVDQMDQALGDPSSSDLNNSSDDILSGFSSMVSLIEPLLLIAIGVVIIGLIRRVQ